MSVLEALYNASATSSTKIKSLVCFPSPCISIWFAVHTFYSKKMDITPPSPSLLCLGPYTFEKRKQILGNPYISSHFLTVFLAHPFTNAIRGYRIAILLPLLIGSTSFKLHKLQQKKQKEISSHLYFWERVKILTKPTTFVSISSLGFKH